MSNAAADQDLTRLRAEIAELTADIERFERARGSTVERRVMATKLVEVADGKGTVRVRLFNSANYPPPQFDGEFVHVGQRHGSGLMFYSQEGTETGGFGEQGGALLTLDAFRQDQTVMLERGAAFADRPGPGLPLAPSARRMASASSSPQPLRLLRTAGWMMALIRQHRRSGSGMRAFAALRRGAATLVVRSANGRSAVRLTAGADGTVRVDARRRGRR